MSGYREQLCTHWQLNASPLSQNIHHFHFHFTDEELNGRNSLAAQRLRLRAFTAMGLGLIPDRGTKIPHAIQHRKKTKNIM